MVDKLAKSDKKKLIALVGTGCAAILCTIVPQFEGVKHVGYLDPVGIPTKCMGDTNDVEVGKHYSAEECKASLNKQLLAHAKPVLACTPSIKGKENTLAASISFAYNIGATAYCNSSTAKDFNAGNYKAGCQKMNRWVYASGKKLPGLVNRRAAESRLCMKGL